MPDVLSDELIADSYVNARQGIYGTRVYYQYLFDLILDQLHELNSSSCIILDLFSGHGSLGEYTERRMDKSAVIAADISPAMMKWNPVGRKLFCDARSLPFKEQSLDAILICGGLHHIRMDDFTNALREIFISLKQGGVLAFYEPVDDNPLVRLIRFIFYRIMPSLGDRESEESVLYYNKLVEDLEEPGFVVKSGRFVGNIGYALLSQTDITFWTRFIARSRIMTGLLMKLERGIQKLPFNKFFSFGCVITVSRPER